MASTLHSFMITAHRVETCRAATDEAKQEARRALAQHEGRKP